MTAELEYSYLNIDYALQISEELMTRAVRVKQAVKEKVKRVFDNSVVHVKQEQPVVEPEVKVEEPKEEIVGLDSLIDLSDENLAVLNSKITALQGQKGILHKVRRAVLFTSALKDKISKVNSKWFPSVLTEDKSSILPNVEVANRLGGEVVPGTWDDMVVGTEEVQEPEFVQQLSPEVENTTMEFVPEPQTIELDKPVTEVEQTVEESSAEVELNTPEVPVIEPVQEEATIVPTVEPTQEPEVQVEEPVAEVEQTVEEQAPEVEVTVPEITLVPQETMEQGAVEVENSQSESIEDRIARMLDRKNEMVQSYEGEVPKISETPVDETKDKELVSEEPRILTKTDITAKLHRFKSTMQEKDAEIAKLRSKLEASNGALDEAKGKISGYETVLSDLNAKCKYLEQTNEQLSARNAEMESTYGSRIESLEGQVTELRQARAEDAEASRVTLDELKVKHAEEIDELNAKHAEELNAERASKDRQINAIYETITEALDPSYSEEEYKKAA